jgi:hypothetical protein
MKRPCSPSLKTAPSGELIWTEGQPQWKKVEGPPEGDERPPLTKEQVAEKLRKKSRAMIIGRGKKT